MSASSLPVEIWLHICKQLCSHCHCASTKMTVPRLPGEYKEEKSALAALSLTCRAMAEIGQPVLYHVFCQYLEDTESKFLRTLVSQPRLARFVRALYLGPGSDDVFAYDEQHEIKKWHEISVNLGVQTPGWVIKALSHESSHFAIFNGPNQESVLRFSPSLPRASWRLVAEYRSWKQLLILGICSTSLTHLTIPDIPVSLGFERRNVYDDNPDDRAQRPFNFRNLISFSCGKTLSLEEFPWFLSQAPLLKHLGVRSYELSKYVLVGKTPPASLKTVTALSVVCGPSSQQYVFQLCPQIRDLDFLLADDHTSHIYSYEAQAPWPAPMENQLRRLRWNAVTPKRDHFHFANSYPSLLDLENLEILEIDRRSLTICLERALGLEDYADEAARLLPTVLPRSLRILNFWLRSGRVRLSTLLIELEALAAAKEITTPMLSLIQIDDFVAPWDRGTIKPYRDVMNALGVFSAMKKAGIELRID